MPSVRIGITISKPTVLSPRTIWEEVVSLVVGIGSIKLVIVS